MAGFSSKVWWVNHATNNVEICLNTDAKTMCYCARNIWELRILKKFWTINLTKVGVFFNLFLENLHDIEFR